MMYSADVLDACLGSYPVELAEGRVFDLINEFFSTYVYLFIQDCGLHDCEKVQH